MYSEKRNKYKTNISQIHLYLNGRREFDSITATSASHGKIAIQRTLQSVHHKLQYFRIFIKTKHNSLEDIRQVRCKHQPMNMN